VSGIIGQKAQLGQGRGPDVELVVSGTPAYATYETVDGFPAIYDDDVELFCYARVVNGAYESTRVPVSDQPPPGVVRHAKEAEEVRSAKISKRQSKMDGRTGTAINEGE
jgi:hypothetical protein